jgi:hypothetical protein
LVSNCWARNGCNCLLLVALSIFLFVSVFTCRLVYLSFSIVISSSLSIWHWTVWIERVIHVVFYRGCWYVNRSVLAVRFTRCVFAYTSFVHFDVIIFLIHLK